MRGQIEKRSEGVYRIRWFRGRDAAGKREYGSRTIHGTKRDAQSALREILRREEQGVAVVSRGETLDAFLDRWLAEAAPMKRRATTVTHYREVLARYVRPYLGLKRLDRLSVVDVQAMIGALGCEGRPVTGESKRVDRRGRRPAARPLSPQTIRYANAVLSAALGQAVRWRLIPANPTRDVELPRRASTRTMRALAPEECAAFLRAATGHRLEALLVLLIGTGLRPGEALGLRWNDLDLDRGTLRVERTLGRRQKGEAWRFEEPKTAGSRRTMPLPASVTRALVAHRKAQAAERLQAGATYLSDLDLVFATSIGAPLDERKVVNRVFKPLLATAELPETVRLYDLRHTAATLMLASGAQVRTVADRLGHASAKMTLDVYAHVLQPQRDDLTASMEAALFGG